MVQFIKQGNIWGRIGSGVGKGLAEQLPKEIERGRLAAGLKELGEKKDQTPFQNFAGLAALPGATPQIIQSGSDLLRQQQYLDSIKNQYGAEGQQPGKKGYSPSQEELNQPVKGEIPSLATPEDTAQSYKTYIPPTEQEERRDAAENFNKNPARYNNDFEEALRERKAITARNQQIQQAHQGQEEIAVGKEGKVKEALKNEINKLGLNNIPPKAYQKFEEKILNSVLSKKEGGEGLTQEQAIKKYSKELDQSNRDYLKLSSLSSWSPADFNRRTDALQKEFESRGELPFMMDQMIKDYQVSPSYAAHKTYPIKKGDVPTLKNLGFQVGAAGPGGINLPKLNDLTYEKLKGEMGDKHAPLSIAYELQQKGQDPRGWINYLINHSDDLKGWQIDQLSNNINILDLKDKWLSAWE